MKRMAERKEGRGRQEKELLLSLALVAWEAALGHNVWRTSVAVGHKSSAKTADCSQKRRGGGGKGRSSQRQQRQRDRYVKWQSNEGEREATAGNELEKEPAQRS